MRINIYFENLITHTSVAFELQCQMAKGQVLLAYEHFAEIS